MADEANRELLYAYIDELEISHDHLLKAQTCANMLDDQFTSEISLWSQSLLTHKILQFSHGRCVVILKLKRGQCVMKLVCSNQKLVYCETCQFIVDAHHMEQTMQNSRPSLLDVKTVLRALAVAKFQNVCGITSKQPLFDKPLAESYKRCKTD